MSDSGVVARVLDGGGLECLIVSPREERLTLRGTTVDVEPSLVEGSNLLTGNRALVDNAWAYAKFTHLKVSLPTEPEQKAAARRRCSSRGRQVDR
ncbi:MAG: hypothetical protein R2713_12455 [Ilumatobacteraceae bacterium]